MALDPEFKAKWVAALRSGEWKQCRGRLFNGSDAYCCLGVAEKLINPAALLATGCLPSLSAALLDKLKPEQMSDLVELNDEHSQSFPEIADYIEANL